jgi:hypothetical protein
MPILTAPSSRWLRFAWILPLLVVTACEADPKCPCYPFGGGGTGPTTPSTGGGPTTYTDADLAFCVSETSRYRATVNLFELVRSAELEAYAKTGAQQDGTSHVKHQHFADTAGGGVALAENELAWAQASQYTSTQQAIATTLSQWWAAGAGGQEYRNMVGVYSQLGCGIYIANGEITIVQDFR